MLVSGGRRSVLCQCQQEAARNQERAMQVGIARARSYGAIYEATGWFPGLNRHHFCETEKWPEAVDGTLITIQGNGPRLGEYRC